MMSFLDAELTALLADDALYFAAFASAALAGLAAGLIYRAAAAVILSFICLLFTVVIGIGQGWSFGGSVLMALGMIASLQSGYLIGISLTIKMRNLKGKSPVQWIYGALFKRDTAG
ncbi:MAG: hypothetical protein HC850_01425 [Rhodomicrobium sp.]|nr:hypothetical protein [Rhodomicrobium sp.]